MLKRLVKKWLDIEALELKVEDNTAALKVHNHSIARQSKEIVSLKGAMNNVSKSANKIAAANATSDADRDRLDQSAADARLLTLADYRQQKLAKNLADTPLIEDDPDVA